MFGCMPIRYCGYNPSVSDTMTTIQMGLAGLNGAVSGLEARNNGASVLGAISFGIGNAAFDVGGALLGNAIDKSTHSYWGTTMNTVMPGLMSRNSFLGMTMFASPFMSPYSMMMPGMGGYPSLYDNGMRYGAPRFGGFCCHC